MDYRDRLADAIKRQHGCTDAKHVRSSAVRELFRGEVAWEGIVDVFDIIGYPKAKRCYAWGYEVKPGDWEIITVLEIPPVTSPETAVKVAIAAHARGVVRQRQ